MRVFVLLLAHFAWFIVCFLSYFYIDKIERSGGFFWNIWNIFLAFAVTLLSAFSVAKLLVKARLVRGGDSLGFIAFAMVLVVNALIAFIIYAVAIIFVYGE